MIIGASGHRPRHCLINSTSTASRPAAITSCAKVLFNPVPPMATSLPAGGHLARSVGTCPLGGTGLAVGTCPLAERLGKLGPVRLTEFRALMAAHFGPLRAPSVAKDHVFAALGDRSVDQALEAGISPRKVWVQVCADFDVPPAMHHGLPD